MQLLKEEFEKYNIPYWLDEGTLLGAIRNGEMIKNDGDIDFSLFYNNIGEIMNILKYLFEKYSFYNYYYIIR
jgi:phosphorylcholine metabolism protein LicD